MNEREELIALRRLAELEAKAAKPAKNEFAFDPERDMNYFDRAAAGAGKAMTDMFLGAKQRLGMASVEDVQEKKRLDAPLMKSSGSGVGQFIGTAVPLAATALIPGAQSITGAGVIGALTGAMQPTESAGETATNVALGGALGAGGQKVANAIGAKLASRAAAPNLTQGQQNMRQIAEQLGMRLTPGQSVGSSPLQLLEAKLEASPVTSGGFNAIRDQNQRVINRAAAKTIGETADEVSQPIIDRALTRTETVFNRVADRTPVPLDPQTVPNRLRQILQDSEGLIGQNASLADNALWARLDDFAFQGGATREQLRTLSSKLGKAARNNMTTAAGDRELGAALREAQNVVEDAIQQSLPQAEQVAYGEARQQYRALMDLLSRPTALNTSSGNVNARSMAGALQARDRMGWAAGRNQSDLYDALRVVQAFPDAVGNSGTATRSMGAADYAMQLPGALLTRAYLSAPSRATIQAAGTGGNAMLRALAPAARLGAMPPVLLPLALQAQQQ